MDVDGVIQHNEQNPQERIAKKECALQNAHDTICHFFIDQVQTVAPEEVLSQFQGLFFTHALKLIPQALSHSLYEIVGLNQEEQFFQTFKRSCYILINNWSATRSITSIQNLIQPLDALEENEPQTCSLIKQRLYHWLCLFKSSQDYQDLKQFVDQLNSANKMESCWSDRYAYYQLASQYHDTQQPPEKREAAKMMSRQLKEKFKFELAIYMAHGCQGQGNSNNPTDLGDNVLRLVQKILSKKGSFSYENLARIFLKQIDGITYKDFKQSIIKYLIFSLATDPCIEMFKQKLKDDLNEIYQQYDHETISHPLILRTCNRLIEYLIQIQGEPSYAFKLLAMQEKSLTLVILLLKIILVCKHSYIHLESCIAKLIQHYQHQGEADCQWLIIFLETLKVTLTIYDENVQFNLVHTHNPQGNQNLRVFSQIKQHSQPFQPLTLQAAHG